MDRAGNAARVNVTSVEVEVLRSMFGAFARGAEVGLGIHDVPPVLLFVPPDAESAAEVMRACAGSNCRVEPVGAGTWLNCGAAPEAPFVMMASTALNTVADYEPEDLTITVGAGTPVADLQAAVAEHGQWFPCDPPAAANATVGGLVATASAGPLRASLGTPRDHVLGVEIVDGAGRILRFGGSVVKNVAGYDIVRPIVGSRGALGMITRVSLRLRPRPAASRTAAIPVAAENGSAIAAMILGSVRVASAELLSPWLATAVIGAAAAHPQWTLLVRVMGGRAEVEDAFARLRAATAAAVPEAPHDIEVDEHCWHVLADAEAAAICGLRLSALPTRMNQTLGVAERLGDAVFTAPPMIAAHAADGIVRIWGNRASDEIDVAINDARVAMNRIDGTLTAFAGIAERQPLDAVTRRLNDGITQVFDPSHILPGYRL